MAEIMLTRRVDSVPVTTNGRLVGMLTATDILRHIQDELAPEGRHPRES